MTVVRPFLIASALLFLQACAKDPHSFRITEKNKDTFLEEIKDMKGLTVDEMRLLIAYQIRGGMSKAFGGAGKNPVGKTVGELISEARKDGEAEKTESDRQKHLAQEAKAKQDAVAAELRKSLNLTVYEKGFLPSNATAGRFRDYITIRCVYENTSAKDIRAFRGSVVFRDLFGTDIYSTRLTITDPLKAGAQAKWDGTIDFNQFVAPQQQFRATELKDMKVIWMPASVIFADGTQVGDDSGSGTN